jgi:hypothetical protein
MKMDTCWVVAACSQKFIDVSEMLATSPIIALMIEGASTNVPSVNFCLHGATTQKTAILNCTQNKEVGKSDGSLLLSSNKALEI